MKNRTYSNVRAIIVMMAGIFCFTAASASEGGHRAEDASVMQVTRQGNVVRVRAVNDRTLHVTVSPDAAYRSRSLVVEEPGGEKVRDRIISRGDQIVLRTGEMEARYDRKAELLSFYDCHGRVLITEAPAGANLFAPTKAPDGGYEVEQRFVLSPDEGFYGLGQYQEGAWNYRGKRVNLVQANMEIANPMMVSDRGYGILWDNYSKTVFDDTRGDYLSVTSEVADGIDYYVILGGGMDGVVKGYRELTGGAPMFPRSFYGFWQSKERYKSFQELTDVVKEYRHRQVPIDNIVLDWSYWGDNTHWNSMRFKADSFPDPAQAIRTLHDSLNVKFTISVWPGVGPKTKVYKDMERIGALFDEPTWAGYKVVDIYNPQARGVFWNHLRDGLYSKGVDGWWLDATEPSFREGFTQDKQEEKSKSAGKTFLGSFHKYLNVYSLVQTKDIYERLRATGDNRRVQILTRSAFAGQQKYGTAVWSGDVSASWETLRKQIPAGLNYSLSGLPYWTSDIGGFFVNERGGEYPRGLDDPAYRELYVRWFQHGAFTPLFRVHGTNVPREVWQFGKPGEPAYEAQVKMIGLRYKLLPYIYSVAWRVTSEGYTMLRPLAMDFGDDPRAVSSSGSYMFGPSILVQPVLRPMYYTGDGKVEHPDTKVEVYLPRRQLWFDLNDPQRVYAGGMAVAYDAPLERMPLLVRAGSVLPCWPAVQHTGENPSELILEVYAGADAEFSIYEDDGESYDYEKGAYARTPVRWDDRSGRLIIGKCEGGFAGMIPQRSIRIVVRKPVADENGFRVETAECPVIYTGKKLVVKPFASR